MNVNFEIADVTRRLVAVGGLQRRGMTVVLGPHGSFVTRGCVAKLTGGILERDHSNGAYWKTGKKIRRHGCSGAE